MDKKIFVHIDILESTHLVGILWTRVKGKSETASFEYARDWLSKKNAFSLEPALMLTEGSFHSGSDKPLFGSIGDSAPDRWGRMLMRRAERRNAATEKRTPRTLFESDYLLQVSDLSRLGALRFSLEEDGPYLSSNNSIPPLIELPKLLSASLAINNDNENIDELQLVLAPGSSLGGARPKASVIDKNGDLLIAKFPHKDDDVDVVKWEAVCLKLAKDSGLLVPEWRLERVGDLSVLLLKRFDRYKKSSRIPFISALSMLDAKDNETRSYLEIADILRLHGASTKNDLKELWKRIVFNILVSNTDDHLRNHGFLYQDIDGWRLSPAYDLNPTPIDIRPRILSTNITMEDATGSLDLVYEVADSFELILKESRNIVSDMKKVVASWNLIARDFKLSKNAIERMRSAFDYDGR